MSQAAQQDGTRLRIAGLTTRYRGVLALSDVSMVVRVSEIVGVIGPNGAGKTTLFNCIAGASPYGGAITFSGTLMDGLPAHRRARLGVARTFQSIALFESLSVADNIRTAAEHREPDSADSDERNARQITESLMEELGLRDVGRASVSGLPIYVQRRVELARALAMAPKLLLLDEPTARLPPHEAEDFARLIDWVRSRHGLSVVLIEHAVPIVMAVADRVVVLDSGRVTAEGTPAEIQRNTAALDSYLGGSG